MNSVFPVFFFSFHAVWTEISRGVFPLLPRRSVPGDWVSRRLHRGLELHHRQDPKGTVRANRRHSCSGLPLRRLTVCASCVPAGSEVPGAGQLHDDGRRRVVHVLQQRHGDVGHRRSGWKD